MHWTEYDPKQSLVAFGQLTCITSAALANADPDSKPRVYYNLETGEDWILLLASRPYRLQPTIGVLTAFWLADNYFCYLGLPDRPSEAPKNDANIKMAYIFESFLPNSSDTPFSLGPPVAALPLAPQPHQSSPAPSAMAPPAVLSVGSSVPCTVVQSAASVMALRAVKILPIFDPPSDPSLTGVSLAVLLSIGLQTTPLLPCHIVLSHLPRLTPLETKALAGVSLSR